MTQQERNKQIALMLGAATKQMMGVNAWVLEEDELNLSFDLFDEKLFSNNGGSGWLIKDLKFHKDWNWLMEARSFCLSDKVIDGTRPFVFGKWEYVYIDILSAKVTLNCSKWTNPNTVEGNHYLNINKKYSLSKHSIIEAVFIAVSDFAKLLNEGKL